MELQAVIMAAGKGSRMTDITSYLIKAILPIANKPMIWYPLNMLQKAGFTEVIVMVTESERQPIEEALNALQLMIRCDIVSIPDDEDHGTADSLRIIKSRIHSDMLVVSCDIITDLSLHLLADVHRTNDATVTMLLAPAIDTTDITVPGPKSNKKQEKELIGLDEKGTRVMFISSEVDLDETISFKKSFFKKFPYVNMKSNLIDAHMYFMKRQVFDILDKNESISTIKGQLIPYLVKQQFQVHKNTSENEQLDMNSSEITPTGTGRDDIMDAAMEMSSWSCEHAQRTDVTCYSYTVQGGLFIRANSVIGYCEANRQVPKQQATLTGQGEVSLVHPDAKISSRTQTGSDSVIGAETEIGEKCGVKRTLIGQHCTIKDKVKINNSVIMNRVTIKEGCVISGSVICDGACVEERCELKDCIVGPEQTVKASSKHTNEAVNQLMEI